MTTQAELDQDLLEVLERHLESRRELLERVRAELLGLRKGELMGNKVVFVEDIANLMDRLIAEAKMPQGSVKG